MSEPFTTRDAVAEVRAALDGLGDALADGDLARVSSIEPRLATAAASLSSAAATAAGRDASASHLAEALREVRVSLTRSRRLGAALYEFVQIALDAQAQGRTAAYGRNGLPEAVTPVRAVDTRT